jgi:hypothetical protein
MTFTAPFFSAVVRKHGTHLVLMEKERRQNEGETFSQIK